MAFADLVAAADRAGQSLLGGEVVTYAPAAGSPVSVTGLFDEQFVLAQSDANAGVETIGPALFVRLSDLPTDPMVDNPIVTVRSVAYHVEERKPDGMGGIVLALRRVR